MVQENQAAVLHAKDDLRFHAWDLPGVEHGVWSSMGFGAFLLQLCPWPGCRCKICEIFVLLTRPVYSAT